MHEHHYHTIRLLIADDHEVFREGFQSMLKKQDEIELIGEAENGRELMQLAASLQPDVIVTDIKMPIIDGVRATRELSVQFPNIPIIALSMFDDDDLIIDMLEAGAKGYLIKNAHKSEIIEAVKTVYNERPYYCNHTTHKLAHLIAKSKYNPFRRRPKTEFTPREKDVIQQICAGLSNKEIAAKLHLSVRTIEGHREKIYEKMEVNNIAGIVIYAIKHGIYKI